MLIQVKPAGIIRMYIQEREMEVPEGTTVAQLVDLLAIPDKLKLMVFVNNRRKGFNVILEDKDEVRLITLLSGG